VRILIAEDDLTSRSILNAVLQKRGHSVEAVADGDSAWAALQRPDAPRLAILDWMMPGLDGLEICRRARGAAPQRQPYLILLTSRADRSDVGAGFEAGADDFLRKPFEVSELWARVDVGRRVIELQEQLAARVPAPEEYAAFIARAQEKLAALGAAEPVLRSALEQLRISGAEPQALDAARAALEGVCELRMPRARPL
jgi:DNA-binding response OmpR family regulator